MILNFIFSNFYTLVLIIWFLFLVFTAIRFWKPVWVKNFSYKKIFWVVIGLNIFYGLFLTWGQYYVWSNGNEITKSLINLPLSKEVPFPIYLEWLRPFFEQSHGYFVFYVWGRFWMSIFLSFLISSIVYFIFKVWNNYRGGFKEEGPILLFILMLISGYPGVLVTISLGFIFSVLFIIFYYLSSYLKKVSLSNVVIEGVFIFSTLISLFFTNLIIKFVIQ